jgi:hypothetical protein
MWAVAPKKKRWGSLDGDQLVAKTVPIHRTTQTQNKHTQTPML